MTERQELGSLEAMLFAHAEPVETARLADALRLDADEVTTLLQKLQKRYDEQESGRTSARSFGVAPASQYSDCGARRLRHSGSRVTPAARRAATRQKREPSGAGAHRA